MSKAKDTKALAAEDYLDSDGDSSVTSATPVL